MAQWWSAHLACRRPWGQSPDHRQTDKTLQEAEFRKQGPHLLSASAERLVAATFCLEAALHCPPVGCLLPLDQIADRLFHTDRTKGNKMRSPSIDAL